MKNKKKNHTARTVQ